MPKKTGPTPKREYVLWGRHIAYGPAWIKISGGSLKDCRREQKYRADNGRGRWELQILRSGDGPTPDAVKSP